jgi:hypothetical protein
MDSKSSITRSALLRSSLAAGAAAAAGFVPRGAGAASTLLAPGDPMPPLAGTTLSGPAIALPDASAGKPFALVLSFTQGSSDASSTWSNALVKALTPKANVYAAIVLDAVPSFVRGTVSGSIKKDADRNYPDREGNVFITYHGGDWPARLPAGKADDVGIVLVDAHGAVLATAREPYSDAALATFLKALP